MKKILFFVFALAALTILGCDFGGNSKKKTAPVPAPVPVTTELEGTWKRACNNSSIGTVIYTGSSFIFLEDDYSTTTCASTNLDKVFRGSGTFVIGSVVSGTIKKIDWTLTKYYVTPKSSTKAASMNSTVYCGFNNWQVNVEKDVTGSTCGTDTLQAGWVIYSIFSISGSNYFEGDESGANDGSTDAKRPTILLTTPYVKQ